MRIAQMPQYDKVEYQARVIDGDINPKTDMIKEKEEEKETEVVNDATE